mmetsp:Transcript_70860/g.112601  ORF Transcript_70860/g.112601 Transcript_70860/m.112601 type:complete len:238 (+) Transcript_70860:3-716(+)
MLCSSVRDENRSHTDRDDVQRQVPCPPSIQLPAHTVECDEEKKTKNNTASDLDRQLCASHFVFDVLFVLATEWRRLHIQVTYLNHIEYRLRIPFITVDCAEHKELVLNDGYAIRRRSPCHRSRAETLVVAEIVAVNCRRHRPSTDFVGDPFVIHRLSIASRFDAEICHRHLQRGQLELVHSGGHFSSVRIASPYKQGAVDHCAILAIPAFRIRFEAEQHRRPCMRCNVVHIDGSVAD